MDGFEFVRQKTLTLDKLVKSRTFKDFNQKVVVISEILIDLIDCLRGSKLFSTN